MDKGRITQTNFGLNYNQQNLHSKNLEGEPEALEELNESMITCNVNPKIWDKEVQNVEQELLQFYSKLNQEETYPLNNCLIHARTVKGLLTPQLENKLNKFTEILSSDLYYISKEEKRMNSKNSADISKLSLIFQVINTIIEKLSQVSIKK